MWLLDGGWLPHFPHCMWNATSDNNKSSQGTTNRPHNIFTLKAHVLCVLGRFHHLPLFVLLAQSQPVHIIKSTVNFFAVSCPPGITLCVLHSQCEYKISSWSKKRGFGESWPLLNMEKSSCWHKMDSHFTTLCKFVRVSRGLTNLVMCVPRKLWMNNGFT